MQEFQRRTFRDESETNILGDLVIFKPNQICPECLKEIDIESISLNYKNMKKDTLWAQCPLCNKYILPRLTVILGNEVNLNEESSKTTTFILHSPYELKVNLKETIGKDGCQYLEVEKFKMKYPSLFWSCIWYFTLLKIDYDIMLPYESNIFRWQKENYSQNNINSNINNAEIERQYKAKKEHKKTIIFRNNYKKYNCYLIIHNAISFYYSNKKFHKYILGTIKESNKTNKDIYNARRTTTFVNTIKKYNSLSEFFNSGQKSNNKINNNTKDDKLWQRITLKNKSSKKYFENYRIEEKE